MSVSFDERIRRIACEAFNKEDGQLRETLAAIATAVADTKKPLNSRQRTVLDRAEQQIRFELGQRAQERGRRAQPAPV